MKHKIGTIFNIAGNILILYKIVNDRFYTFTYTKNNYSYPYTGHVDKDDLSITLDKAKIEEPSNKNESRLQNVIKKIFREEINEV